LNNAASLEGNEGFFNFFPVPVAAAAVVVEVVMDEIFFEKIM
jgi:hypothetical protein